MWLIALLLWAGNPRVEPKDADQQQTNEGSNEQEGLPTGLKSDVVHGSFFGVRPTDVRCMLSGLWMDWARIKTDSESKVTGLLTRE